MDLSVLILIGATYVLKEVCKEVRKVKKQVPNDGESPQAPPADPRRRRYRRRRIPMPPPAPTPSPASEPKVQATDDVLWSNEDIHNPFCV